MADTSPTAKIEAQTRQQVDAWLAQVNEGIRAEPGAPEYPLSVLMLASALDEKASRLHWMLLADAKLGDKPNGWAQALYLSRDLLTVLARLDNDFQLGMHLLPAVIAAHPLFQHYGNQPPPKGRTVTELVEDRAHGKGGPGTKLTNG